MSVSDVTIEKQMNVSMALGTGMNISKKNFNRFLLMIQFFTFNITDH